MNPKLNSLLLLLLTMKNAFLKSLWQLETLASNHFKQYAISVHTLIQNMTMASHITNVSRTITFHLRNISRIRRYIGKDTCHHAVSSLILSRIDYCNSLLLSPPKSYTLGLQRLKIWAARLVFTVNRQQDPKQLLKYLHWLPVKQRISFKLLLYVLRHLIAWILYIFQIFSSNMYQRET